MKFNLLLPFSSYFFICSVLHSQPGEIVIELSHKPVAQPVLPIDWVSFSEKKFIARECPTLNFQVKVWQKYLMNLEEVLKSAKACRSEQDLARCNEQLKLLEQVFDRSFILLSGKQWVEISEYPRSFSMSEDESGLVKIHGKYQQRLAHGFYAFALTVDHVMWVWPVADFFSPNTRHWLLSGCSHEVLSAGTLEFEHGVFKVAYLNSGTYQPVDLPCAIPMCKSLKFQADESDIATRLTEVASRTPHCLETRGESGSAFSGVYDFCSSCAVRLAARSGMTADSTSW